MVITYDVQKQTSEGKYKQEQNKHGPVQKIELGSAAWEE